MTLPSPPAPSPLLSARGLPPGLPLALWLLPLLAFAAVGWALWHSHEQTLQAETDVLRVMARAVAVQVDSTLQATDASLAATAAELALSAEGPLDREARQALRDRAERLPLFDTLAVLDIHGRVIAAASDTPGRPPPREISLPFALAHSTGFQLGRALVRRAAAPAAAREATAAGSVDASVLVVAVRPWVGAEGDRRGWVVALAEPAFFSEQLFRKIAWDRSPTLGLWSDAGEPLNLPESIPGAQALRERLIATPPRRDPRSATLPPPLPDDGIDEVVAGLQPLASHPLVVTASRPRGPVLAGWTTQAITVGVVGLVALALVAGLLVRAARVRERLAMAQAEAAASAARLAERMNQANRMEALGTLAGGIAHDFNNLLAAVAGYGEMARDAAVDGSAQARHLDQVLQAAARGRGLTARILAFSRRGRMPAAPLTRFDARPVVEEVLGLLRASLPQEIELRARLEAQAASLDGDPTLLFECVMNLCTNALHAMPAGGVLEVRLDTRVLSEPLQARHGWLEAGPAVELLVQDTGVGMDDATLARIFEPFFSLPAPAAVRPGATKPHQGTGLGLAVVHDAVVAMGGSIDVQTHLGSGSTFRLLLPQARGQAMADTGSGPDHSHDHALVPASSDEELPLGQGQTVMWVDDDPALVAYGEELLAELGYEPVGFNRSGDALAALQRQPDGFDAIVTDQVMPELNGLELAAALHVIRPGFPVVMVTGQESLAGATLDAPRVQAAGLAAVLVKPVDRNRLARAMAAACAQRGAERS